MPLLKKSFRGDTQQQDAGTPTDVLSNRIGGRLVGSDAYNAAVPLDSLSI